MDRTSKRQGNVSEMVETPETQRRRYPVGVQTFEDVRTNFDGYVDKTGYVYRLATSPGKTFFLSRPRRFGKSLLLSTMQAYFEGRRELFGGLAIEKLETAWESHPVIRLDLSTVKTRDIGELRALLDFLLSRCENEFGCDPNAQTPGSRLFGLIQRAHNQSGKQVIVLVDEYDAPLLNVVDDPDKLQAFREVMREFYAPLKACDAWLRFVFLTGITKFSQLSIFSELNNLQNISMDSEFAAICGISEQELVGQMSLDVDLLAVRLGIGREDALGRLKDYYDGYHFVPGSPDLYNPFSLLSAFARGRIDPYWFGSGTPTSLIAMLKTYGWELADLEGCEAAASEFDAPTESMDTPLPMLYQAGYLTIKAYDDASLTYTLGIPNREVRQGLAESLVRHAAPGALRSHNAFLRTFAAHLRADDIESALQDMKSYLAGIPYHLGSHDERGFQTTLYLVFDLLGMQIDTEFKTATGRADAVIRTTNTVYVMEFKYGKSAAEALAQIDRKGYLVPFERDGRRLVKVGVNFSPQTRSIDEWLVEEA